jgi:hypothetical protein
MVLPVTSQNLPMTSQHNVDVELKECGTKKLQSAVRVIKLFFFLATMNRNNKLERLSQASLSSLVSISPTFYEQLLRQYPFAKKLQTKILST